MKLSLIPINVVSAPNYWAPLGVNYWEVTGGVSKDIWGSLQVEDTLGTRPYIPISGAQLQAVFQRGDHIGGNTTTLTVTKIAALDTSNRSLAKIALTAQDATSIISGTIVFTLTEGSIQYKWVQNWAVKKLNTSAGF